MMEKMSSSSHQEVHLLLWTLRLTNKQDSSLVIQLQFAALTLTIKVTWLLLPRMERTQ